MCNEIEIPTYKLQKTERRLIIMKEDKFADEVMSDEELDGVAGGSFEELKADADALQSKLPVGIKLSRPRGCW